MTAVKDGPPDQLAIPQLVARLVDDAKTAARAEVGVYKAKASERVTAYKGAAILLGTAAVLGLAALVALLVGAILTVATLVGPGWATLIVVGVVSVVALALALIGKGRLSPPSSGGSTR